MLAVLAVHGHLVPLLGRRGEAQGGQAGEGRPHRQGPHAAHTQGVDGLLLQYLQNQEKFENLIV